MTSAPEEIPEPVFIGGFGRSGTHAVGPLVGADPRYHLVETEARFHAVRGGLPDLLAGETSLAGFVEGCRTTWWRRGFMRPQGLHRLVEREALEAALGDFERRFGDDPWDAARTLTRRLIDPTAERAGKPAWVELTGRCVIYAPTLLRLFPRARFINMVRDGRAVAGGHVKKIDMTDDPMEALEGWERMIRASAAGIRAVPEEAVLVIHLDDLVANDREGTFRRIAEFLETPDEGPMRRWFDRRISAEKAHVDKWRERMPPPEARRVDRRYRRMVRELHRDGVDWVPAPEDGGIRLGPLRVPMPVRS
ncbi:MAG TPA: sulfotransferase [Thermoleophilaceae bacterium]|nr:sulfotransferase [Thermoleophilaceae bacterium]